MSQDLSNESAKTLYNRVVLPGLLYGAEIWGDKATKAKIKKQQLITQRMFLRAMVPCYMTTSTQALFVIAGVAPLHIESERRARAYVEKDANNAAERIRSRWNGVELQHFISSHLRKDQMQSHIKLYVDFSSDLSGGEGVRQKWHHGTVRARRSTSGSK